MLSASTAPAPSSESFNGAASTWTRKLGELDSRARLNLVLQWGRVHVDAEITTWRRHTKPRAPLQWDHIIANGAASMGPRPRGRGNVAFGRPRRSPGLASMGPRPRGRGNLAGTGYPGRSY